MDPNSRPSETQARRTCQSGAFGNNFFTAVFLIVAGILLFLSSIGWLPIRNIWDYWPVFLVIAGVGNISNSRAPQQRVWGALMILFGLMFLGSNLGLFHIREHQGNWIVAMVFLGVGISKLITLNNPVPRKGQMRLPNEAATADSSSDFYAPPRGWTECPTDVLNDLAIFGGVKRRIESNAFQGGELQSIFGSIELDLRYARPFAANQPMVVQVSVVFGAIKLRIPESWRVAVRATGALGACEDKTIPQAKAGSDSPVLVITGHFAFGSVEIEN